MDQIKKIKVVEWQGSISPVYEEVGELQGFMTDIGYNSDAQELCIDIEDLLEWIRYRR